MTPFRNIYCSTEHRSLVLATVMGGIAIAAGGLVHGELSNRWGADADLSAAAVALDTFPASFGAWRQQSDEPIGDDVLEILQCANHVHRTYINAETAEHVSVAVIVGQPGPTAVHTPEICYSSRDYAIEKGRVKKAIKAGGALHSFWQTEFKSRKLGGARLVVYYAWTDGDYWQASDAPRYQFGGSPYLFKIQLAGVPLTHDRDQNAGDDLCLRFLKDLCDFGWTTSRGN